jgi:GMP synthase-like glutamine amidotransferase
MSRHLLVLDHGPLVGPATLVASLDGRAGQLPWRRVELAAGDPLPPLDDDVAGVLCLGGIMDWDDEDPWLGPERDLLAAAVANGTPVLGICLGAQQLAVALGGEVRPLPTLNADLPGLVRTAAGRRHDVLAGWADGAPGLFHHRDGVRLLPDGAETLLAGSERTVAAWCDATDTALAVQFHPEADTASVVAWADLLGDALPYDRDPFLARVTAAAPGIRAAGVALVARWLDVRVLPATR